MPSQLYEMAEAPEGLSAISAVDLTDYESRPNLRQVLDIYAVQGRVILLSIDTHVRTMAELEALVNNGSLCKELAVLLAGSAG